MRDSEGPGAATASEKRFATEDRPALAGIPVREEDIEPAKAIRTISMLFRGMAILLLILAVVQVIFGLTSTVPISIGVLLADAVRLLIFAGLLWGGGELAILWVKSHYDLRATRILIARLTYLVQQVAHSNGRAP